ncbi:hypothetical protein BV898_02308 [Hypsibius exemplaris]|uniref:Large ribosomal subunit protein bL36m n=1 Tax=Hypsibius exemplaris TaxID=2072580 RepID=A0A1W0X9M0_HYPEX|nr:hypothetical protein BV898_02308 [Hypsibius exemplaris]
MASGTYLGVSARALTTFSSRTRSMLQPKPLLSANLLGASQPQTPMLNGTPWSLVPVRTYVVKDKLRLRCEECYFATRQGEKFVECRLRPRHKQRLKTTKKHWAWRVWNLRNVW